LTLFVCDYLLLGHVQHSVDLTLFYVVDWKLSIVMLTSVVMSYVVSLRTRYQCISLASCEFHV